MKTFLLAIAFVSCGVFAQEEPQCQAPNGGGLHPVLSEFWGYVPVDDIMDLILDRLSYCPQTKAAFEYLRSDDFRQIVELVQSQQSFKSLLQYFCQDLYFDVAYYLNQLHIIFGLPELRNANLGRGMVDPGNEWYGKGFMKLLLDIYEITPMETLKTLLEERLKTDYYLQLAFEKVNSDEFGVIIETLQSSAAYVDMKDRLRAIHVDIDSIVESAGKIFRPGSW